jgi:hypothetical protein
MQKGHAMALNHPKPANRICEVCSAPFYTKPSQIAKGNGRFCSKTCQNQSRIVRLERECEVCGTPFATYPGLIAKGRGRFCSKDCQKRWQVVPIRERFWRYIGPPEPNGCILWTGARSIGDYGVIGSGTGKGHMVYANRVSYEMFVGPIPDGLFVLHRCDTPPCVNPFHLFLGTTQDNIADKIAKGRQAKGEGHGIAKLTDAKVRDIRERYARGGISHERLGWEYRVSHRTIGMIVNNKTWTHVE